MVSEFQRQLSPVLQFVAERCDLGAGFWVSTLDMFAPWNEWCMNRDIEPGDGARLGQSLMGAVGSVRPRRRGPRGQQVPGYAGIRLRDGAGSQA